VAAEIQFDALPVSACLRPYLAQAPGARFALAGGDDYELCFTAPALRHADIEKLSAQLNLQLTCIGKIVAGTECKGIAANGSEMKIKETGYEHFA